MGEARPHLALPPVGKDAEIELREARTLRSMELIGDPFVLDGAFVVSLEAANHEGDVRTLPKVLALPRGPKRIEDDLELIGNGDPDDCALWRTVGVQRALHRIATAAHEGQQRRTCDGHLGM